MKLLFKDALLKIKKSVGRYLSIIFIITLGVAIFVGLMVSSPMMLDTADDYIDKFNLYDGKIISTLGFNDENIEALRNLEMIDEVIPTYSTDAIMEDKVYKVYAIDTKPGVDLLEGRMPTKPNECLASYLENEIGDKISLTKEDIEDELSVTEYEVVGLIRTPIYMHKSYGSTTLGNGTIYSFIYVPKENFAFEVYTDALIYLNSGYQTFDEEYKVLVDGLDAQFEAIAPFEEKRRYDEVYNDAMKEITDAEEELETETNDAKKELADALIELEDGEKEYAKAVDKYEAAKELIEMGYSMIDRQIGEAVGQANQGIKQYEDGIKQVDTVLDSVDGKEVNIPGGPSGSINITVDKNTVNNLTGTLLAGMIGNPGINIDGVSDAEKEALVQFGTMVGNSTIGDFHQGLKDQKNTLTAMRDAVKGNKQDLIDDLKEKELDLLEAEDEIKDARKELDDGWQEYNDGLEELETETRDAKEEIADAYDDLNDLEMTEWFYETRLDLEGIHRFHDDAFKVAAIGAVFPVFFMLVVALVVSNTLTRLVEEERGLTGTYLSLGYSNKSIISSYIVYIILANIIGVLVGSFAAYLIISPTIYNIYHSMYITPDLNIVIDYRLILAVFIVFLALVSFVTYTVVRKELKEQPSELLRPKAPKKGKRILLEKIKFIWNHTSFIWKVTFRNLFRYKKRVLMTVLGVAGCTALLLVGFGLQDGINGLGAAQYEDIVKYDGFIILKEEQTGRNSSLDDKLHQLGITDTAYAYQANIDVGSEQAYLVVYENQDDYTNLYHFMDYDMNDLTLDNNSVIIDKKLSLNNKVKSGDTLTVTIDNHNYDLQVTDVNRHHLLHYIHMPKDYYLKNIDDEINYNFIYFNAPGIDEDTLANKLLENDEILGVSYTTDMLGILDEVVKGINVIVYLIIVFALLLAFTVLYNLTIINITERVREIATLKVLGFKPKEVNAYIFREILILCFIGIAVGLFLGFFMEQYVIRVAESADMIFIREMDFSSYIYASIITLAFTIVIQLVTYFKLEKIDMIESLKSIE